MDSRARTEGEEASSSSGMGVGGLVERACSGTMLSFRLGMLPRRSASLEIVFRNSSMASLSRSWLRLKLGLLSLVVVSPTSAIVVVVTSGRMETKLERTLLVVALLGPGGELPGLQRAFASNLARRSRMDSPVLVGNMAVGSDTSQFKTSGSTVVRVSWACLHAASL